MKPLLTFFVIGFICCGLLSFSNSVKAQITINTTVAHTTCSLCNGSASFTFSGGVAPYSISWEQGSWVNQPLCAGVYTITVTDATAQTAATTFAINSSEAIELTLPQPEHMYSDCNDVCILFNTSIIAPTGFANYVWSGNGMIYNQFGHEVSVDAPGTYCVTVTNSNGCTGSACATVFAIATCSHPSYCGTECMGIAEVLHLNGGTLPYTYTWSNGVTGTPVQTGLCQGSYDLTVADANNIQIVLPFYVAGSMYQQYLLPPYINYCPDNPINYPINLPYVYCQWNDGITGCSRNLTNVGNYSVTVTDEQDCRFSDSALVSTLSSVYIFGDLNLTNALPCTTLNAGYGAFSTTSYQWSDGQTTQNVQVCSPGVYCVTATSSTYNCSSTNCVTVTLNGIIVSAPQAQANGEMVRIWHNAQNKTLCITPALPDNTGAATATLTFYDIVGREQLAARLPLNTLTNIDVSHWQSGIYYWQLAPSAAAMPVLPQSGKVWVQ